MFDRIAPTYDRMNTLFSLDRDRWWRRRAADRAQLQPGQTAVDLCTGTGKLAHELWRRVRPGGRVIGIDFAPGMLALARVREPGIEFVLADATRLPLADATADAVTIAFGYRNLIDRRAGLREMHRVLRPNGRAVILEFTPPPTGTLMTLYRVYLTRVMPGLAGLLRREDGDAYRYLAESVEAFPSPPAVSAQMREAGFTDVRAERLSFGIVGIHTGIHAAQRS